MQLGIPKLLSRLGFLGVFASAVVGARDAHRTPESASLSVFNRNDVTAHFKKNIVWDC